MTRRPPTARAPAQGRRARGRQPANEGEEEAVVASLRVRLGLVHSRTFPWVPELYGLLRKDCGISLSTERTCLRSVWPWYHHYCLNELGKDKSHVAPGDGVQQSQLLGLELYHAECFTSTASDHEQYNKDHIRKFFDWMMDLGVGRNLIKKTKTFFNAHLRAEHHNRMLAANHRYPQLGRAEIGHESFAKSALKDAAQTASDRAREEYVCIHSNVDKPITPTETRDMLQDVFEPKPNGEVAKLDALYRLVFASSYCASAQDLRRGEEHYKQWYNTRYIRRNEELGNGDGPFTHLVKSVKSKHNTQNRRETFGGIPNRNPLNDFVGWNGILLSYRLVILKEPFPDFLDYKKLWYVASYPSLSPAEPGRGGPSLFARITSSQYRACWKAFYLDNKICTGYITKQWRHQGYHDADDRGCDQSAIQKIAGWRHDQHADKETKAERDHYANNVPLRGMVTMAKGDPKHPQHFYLPRYVQVYDEFLNLFAEIAPHVTRQKEVETKYKTYRTKKSMCSDRVATAHETALNFLEELRSGFRFLASRPVDPRTLQLLPEEPCFFDKFRYCSTLRHFFDHPAFQSEHWKDLCSRVRASEDAEFGRVFTLPPQVRNDMDLFRNQMHTMVSVLATQVKQQNQETREMVQQAIFAVRRSESVATDVPATSIRCFNSPPTAGAQRPIFPVAAPPPSEATGTKRRRVSHEAVARAEVPCPDDGICPRPRLAGRDRLFNSAQEYWRLWKDEFEPMERRWKQAWRNDRAYVQTAADGKLKRKKANTKATWWNERKYIWECIEHWIANCNMTEEAAVAKAEGIYDSCRPVGRTTGRRKPALRDVHKAYSNKAKQLGIWSVGRPKHSDEEFERQFGWAVFDANSRQAAATVSPASREAAEAEARHAAAQRNREAAHRAAALLPRMLDPSDPLLGQQRQQRPMRVVEQRMEMWAAGVRQQERERPQHPHGELYEIADLANRGRTLTLPPIQHFQDMPRNPEGAPTPPERRPHYGPYRPDYTGTQWTQPDLEATEALATLGQLFPDDQEMNMEEV